MKHSIDLCFSIVCLPVQYNVYVGTLVTWCSMSAFKIRMTTLSQARRMLRGSASGEMLPQQRMGWGIFVQQELVIWAQGFRRGLHFMTYKREKNEIYIPNMLSSPFPSVIRGTRHIIHNHLMAGQRGEVRRCSSTSKSLRFQQWRDSALIYMVTLNGWQEDTSKYQNE